MTARNEAAEWTHNPSSCIVQLSGRTTLRLVSCTSTYYSHICQHPFFHPQQRTHNRDRFIFIISLFYSHTSLLLKIDKTHTYLIKILLPPQVVLSDLFSLNDMPPRQKWWQDTKFTWKENSCAPFMGMKPRLHDYLNFDSRMKPHWEGLSFIFTHTHLHSYWSLRWNIYML
jgi:hypothetical protein